MGLMKSTKLFRSRYLLPMTGKPIEDGALLIAGGQIVAVGRFSDLRGSAAELVDCGDAVILPPLVNAHCHLELTDFPQWAIDCGEGAEPTSFVGWIQRLVRIRRQLGSAPNPASIRRGIAQLLASGTGAVGDIVSWLPGAQVTAVSPLHGRLYCETLGLDPERFIPLLAAATNTATTLSSPLTGGLSPHAPYTLSAEHLGAAVASGLPLAIHCAESLEESEFLRSASGPLADQLYRAAGWSVPPPSGLSPVAWLDAQGALTDRTLLIHGVQVDAADVALIARRGSSVVLCPRSNARLQVGTAPVALYREYGVALALGTDSLASNDSLSLWDELAFARTVYPQLSPVELLAIATRGGAQALGIEMGELTPGSSAHFQVLRPSEMPRPGELLDYLCCARSRLRVESLWLDGYEVLAHSDDSSL